MTDTPTLDAPSNRIRQLPQAGYLGLAAVVLLAGAMLRLAPLGLPYPVTKWGGSILWAVMVYWLFAAFLPGRSVWTVAAVAGVFASLVEVSRLYHTPSLDAFRLTLAGALLLGRVFQPMHFACYWSGIVATAAVDWAWFRRKLR